MRILGVYLKNVRSYSEGLVVFPYEGVTVIYGPTGSGKTSILMAISHALFGSPSGFTREGMFDPYEQPRAQHVLRAGSREGLIRLLISVKKKLYVIERAFEAKYERGQASSVEFKYGKVEEYELDESTGRPILCERKVYTSRSDFDSKIAEIIGIKERVGSAKTTRATVFTSALYVPQFNIHEILEYTPEQRREIVEKAFGLEKYKVIRSNLSKLKDKLAKEVERLEGSIQQLQSILLRKSRSELTKKLEEIESELSALNSQRRELEDRLATLEGEKLSIKSRVEELRKAKQEVEYAIRKYESSRQRLLEVRDRLCKLVGELSRISSIAVESCIDMQVVESFLTRISELKAQAVTEINQLERDLEVLEQKLKEVESSERSLLERYTRLEAEINTKMQVLQELKKELDEKKRLVEQGVCPLCLQSIPHEHGYKLLNDIRKRVMEVESDIKSLEAERSLVDSQRTSLRSSIESITREITEKEERLSKLRDKLSSIEKLEGQVRLLFSEASTLSAEVEAFDLDEARKKLVELTKELEELNAKLEVLEEEARKVNEGLKMLSLEIGRKEGERNGVKKELEELNKVESELAEVKKRRDASKSLLNKLDTVEKHIVEPLEKEVTKVIARQFKDYFANYVRILMHDQPLDVVVTDDFDIKFRVLIGEKPLEITSLSGGQGIALSLAYRLALNTIVRKYSPHLKKSVLILDEPTTGFSPDMVQRLKELLEGLRRIGLGQIIIVTHDKSLAELGDCRIRLQLDVSKHETRVFYEECVMSGMSFEEYKQLVEAVLKGKISGASTASKASLAIS